MVRRISIYTFRPWFHLWRENVRETFFIVSEEIGENLPDAATACTAANMFVLADRNAVNLIDSWKWEKLAIYLHDFLWTRFYWSDFHLFTKMLSADIFARHYWSCGVRIEKLPCICITTSVIGFNRDIWRISAIWPIWYDHDLVYHIFEKWRAKINRATKTYALNITNRQQFSDNCSRSTVFYKLNFSFQHGQVTNNQVPRNKLSFAPGVKRFFPFIDIMSTVAATTC